MASLENLMAQLADSTRRPAASQLARLSDLSLAEASRFEELWPGLGVVRRRQVIRQLAADAESRVEMNFDRVFNACLKDSDEVVRVKAIEGLWECHDTGLIETLVTMLLEDPAQSVRAAAAKALGVFVLLTELGKLRPRYHERLSDSLMKVLQNSGQPIEVRQQALESLAYFSETRVVDVIEEAYKGHERDMKLSALRAMGRNLDGKWLELLLTEMSSAETEFRLEAVKSCGEMGDQKAVLRLIERAEDEEAGVQLAAVHALGQIGGKRAIKALAALVQHPKAAVREAAREALQEAQFSEDTMSLPIEG